MRRIALKYNVNRAYVFGSYATGRPSDHSDIDLAVVFGDGRSGEEYDHVSFEVFHEAQQFNSLIEVLCFRDEEFEQGAAATIVKRIKAEGVRVDF